MKVKIIKAKRASYWYANRIGETIEVLDDYFYTKPNGTKAYSDGKGGLIDVNDTDEATKEKVIFT